MERMRNQTLRGFSRDVTAQQHELAAAMIASGPQPFEDTGLMLGDIKSLAPEQDDIVKKEEEEPQTADTTNSPATSEDPPSGKKRAWRVAQLSQAALVLMCFSCVIKHHLPSPCE